ncbi:mechanosensitive ion channel family protein [Kitasatospora sp. RB6PN24]|uniref:mechanosensitive ion channel family protein n=1 Tax=Kitasatospora humi TaxID=2893891 RepID=UPI001E33DEA2|nr:mechanosensitive ion channel domain-containing protein [Kitasatospora humi]MCC9308927.1 mechanosensitive ion channel family protein [Kitasatospora humi]
MAVLWPLVSLLAIAAVTLVVGWLVDRGLQRLSARHPNELLWTPLRRCRVPLQLVVATGLLLGAGSVVHPGRDLGHLVLLALIASVGWLLVRIDAAALTAVLARYEVVAGDPARLQRVRTQLGMLRRVLSALIAVVTIAVMLLTFGAMRAVGTSLLASAGIIGIVAGIAAQNTLGNFFAGLQIAFGDTVRIGDTVVVDGQQGTVEEITLVYLVVRLWDDRRLVVPVSYFVARPFENWTRRDPALLASVLLHVDHTVPVPELRERLREVLTTSPHWDGRDSALVVFDSTPSTVLLRATMTAAGPAEAFALRCTVREELVAFLRDRHPHALPRLRTGDRPTGD